MTTTVIVPQRLGASETLKKRVGRENHLPDALDPTITSCFGRNCGNVLHDSLSGLSLACTTFPRDDDTLILLVALHVVI